MIDQCHKKMQELADEMKRFPWEDKNAYLGYLAQTYYYCRNTTRLLALTSSRFPLNDEKVHQRFLTHIREENKHEQLAIKDIENLGHKIEEFKELPALKAFYQVQYYYIEHLSPWAFFGYILSLENLSIAVGQEVLDRTFKEYGEKATRFLKVHVEEDVGHVDLAFKQLEHLSKKEWEYIYQSVESSTYLFGQTLREIADGAHFCTQNAA